MKYTSVKDGIWYEMAWTRQRDCCCDCGLVHVTDFKVENGKLLFNTRRSERATREARKQFKFEK